MSNDPLIIAVVAAVASIGGMTITAVISRRNARDTNRIDEFEATLAGLKEVIAGLRVRITDVETELGTVKTALVAEQQQHAATRELLRIAMRHIRDMLSWLGGTRVTDPPPVPDELTHQL